MTRMKNKSSYEKHNLFPFLSVEIYKISQGRSLWTKSSTIILNVESHEALQSGLGEVPQEETLYLALCQIVP